MRKILLIMVIILGLSSFVVAGEKNGKLNLVDSLCGISDLTFEYCYNRFEQDKGLTRDYMETQMKADTLVRFGKDYDEKLVQLITKLRVIACDSAYITHKQHYNYDDVKDRFHKICVENLTRQFEGVKSN